MYEIFEKLLEKHGITAYRVAKETGITTATLTSWKQGKYVPKKDKLQKIADYFGVTVDYLMGIEKDENVQYYLNDETKEIAQEIFENKDMRILFDVARNTKPEHLKAYADFLKKLQDKEEGNEEWYILIGVYTILSDDMPSGFKGHVNHNKDDSYTIFINAKLSYEEQKKVYLHELCHIVNDDFQKHDCDLIESMAHK